ncbi:uncharacterized protein LOC143281194 [Babylonia areolata]|uniref:uncharacterized protein LOC143281194 n=1 Tax=Babylonia areolata TaxID=304850 RepID=UPI003FD52D59
MEKKPEVKCDDDDDDVFTETTIVGVTESGVIRKRSVKKRITRDDASHAGNKKTAAGERRKYGHDTEEYRKLEQRVLSERVTVNALEVLQERWRMISFMYEDCLDMVRQWDEQRLMRQQKKRKRRLLFLSFLSLPIVFSVVTWFLVRFCW